MPRGEVEGKNKLHTFDAVVRNGIPHFAVDALSFELPKATNLDLLVYSKAWELGDVLEVNPSLPIGIFALPPVDRSSSIGTLYNETVRTYRSIGVDVLTDQTFTEWSERMAATISLEQ